MLINVVTKTALSKTTGISCLCAARRLPCPFMNRECAGCAYAIYEMSVFFHLLRKVKNMYSALAVAKTEGERRKIQMLLDNEILPAVCEVLVIAKDEYGMEVHRYKEQLVNIIRRKGIEEC